jgi:hypothetical protein
MTKRNIKRSYNRILEISEDANKLHYPIQDIIVEMVNITLLLLMF